MAIMNLKFDFNNPTRILFGSGALNELGSQRMPGKKALLLMSGGKSARVSGAYGRTLEQLARAGVEAVEFAKVMENPIKEMVMEGAAFARENGCDFIVALGGGAVLDSAVAIAAMATNPGDLWDYVNGGTGKGASRPAHRHHHAHRGHGVGSQLLGRDFQPGNQGKNRLWLSRAHARAGDRGPGADENRARQIHGLPGL